MKITYKAWIAVKKCCGDPDTNLLYSTRKIARKVNKGLRVVPCVVTYEVPASNQ